MRYLPPFFVGAGAYRHHVPASVDHLIQRSRVPDELHALPARDAQGTLQYLFEFQTQVALLTGMEVANASMYDGSTGDRRGRADGAPRDQARKAVLSGGLHPHYRATSSTISRDGRRRLGRAAAPIRTRRGSSRRDRRRDVLRRRAVPTSSATCATSRRSPRRRTRQGRAADRRRHRGRLARRCSTPPGEMGADIVVGEGQSIGNALNFGGPYVGLFATREKYVRQMPGRLCGETVDAEGRRGFVLTLSTREQHIRREKATSNICTNSGLCALAFTIHMTLLGEAGLRGSRAQPRQCGEARRTLAASGRRGAQRDLLQRVHDPLPGDAAAVVERWPRRACSAACRPRGSSPAARLADLILVAATESTPTTIARALRRGAEGGAVMSMNTQGRPTGRPRHGAPPTSDLHRQSRPADRGAADLRDRRAETPASTCPSRRRFEEPPRRLERKAPIGLPASPSRGDAPLRAPVAEELRIDAGLYPLGSCTMKHNPRLNEKMARLPGFGDIHPLQPVSTVQGALELIDELATG
jgi:glycine dehydrogenase subunit 1